VCKGELTEENRGERRARNVGEIMRARSVYEIIWGKKKKEFSRLLVWPKKNLGCVDYRRYERCEVLVFVILLIFYL
jgi:hypothetical protein